jgi:type VI secretion system secreted protein VgrG
MGARSTPSSPSSDAGCTDPVDKTKTGCADDKKCWVDDYDKEISITSSYGRYCHKYKPDGTEYATADLPVLKFRGKIYAPVKTGNKITVEVRFKTQKAGAATDADVTTAKTKLENGVNTHWNNKFTLEADDPDCGKKSFKIEYKIVWVTSGENYILSVHDAYPREGEGNGTVNVSRTTTEWIFAHEFGHCVGLPDEYSSKGGAETVKYIKPDGTLDGAVTAPPYKPKTDADATIMSSLDNTTTLKHHAWNIAIETQELLTAKLGRTIKCTIK